MIILGIETSCDDSALALIETRLPDIRIIASLVHSQAELHSAYGGVFPTLAKREHSKNLVPLLHKLLDGLTPKSTMSDELFAAKMDEIRREFGAQNPDLIASLSGADFLKAIPDIDHIAVTEGPGLEPALWVGIIFARILGTLWNVPISPVNHMEGHIVGSLIDPEVPYGAWGRLKELPLPSVALLISGGHTELVLIEGDIKFNYKIIGQTRDDAVGEAFDKVARLLGLQYPGGPHIAKLAHEAYEAGIASPIKLPRPMISSKDLDFSFSGLKTAVLYAVRDENAKNKDLSDTFKRGLAREFEGAVTETLDAKLRSAIDQTGARSLIIGGGVSANHVLRARFAATTAEYGIPLYMPSRHVSGDNALMIALAAAINEKPLAGEGKGLRADGTKSL